MNEPLSQLLIGAEITNVYDDPDQEGRVRMTILNGNLSYHLVIFNGTIETMLTDEDDPNYMFRTIIGLVTPTKEAR